MGVQRGSIGRVLSEQHQAALMRIVESEVLPRLLLSLADPPQAVRAPEVTRSSNTANVAAFADVLLYGDRSAARAFVRAARQHGMPLADVYIEVISPAARFLCARWEQDACSFHQVAGALIRLLSVLREVGGSDH
jgi:hypothetical protein